MLRPQRRAACVSSSAGHAGAPAWAKAPSSSDFSHCHNHQQHHGCSDRHAGVASASPGGGRPTGRSPGAGAGAARRASTHGHTTVPAPGSGSAAAAIAAAGGSIGPADAPPTPSPGRRRWRQGESGCKRDSGDGHMGSSGALPPGVAQHSLLDYGMNGRRGGRRQYGCRAAGTCWSLACRSRRHSGPAPCPPSPPLPPRHHHPLFPTTIHPTPPAVHVPHHSQPTLLLPPPHPTPSHPPPPPPQRPLRPLLLRLLLRLLGD